MSTIVNLENSCLVAKQVRTSRVHKAIMEAVITHGPQTVGQLAEHLMVHKAVVLKALVLLGEQGKVRVCGENVIPGVTSW